MAHQGEHQVVQGRGGQQEDQDGEEQRPDEQLPGEKAPSASAGPHAEDSPTSTGHTPAPVPTKPVL